MGFGLRRWGKVQKEALSTTIFYLFSPCLLFYSLVTSTIDVNVLLRLFGFAFVAMISMGVLGLIVGRILHFSWPATVILILAATFSNNANYGLSVIQLRFGDEGMSYGLPYMTMSSILLYTVGVLIAASGKLSLKASIKRLFQLPIVYTLILAAIVIIGRITVPAPILNGLKIASTGAIPVMLVLLGMQMADTQRLDALKIALPAVALRLFISPIIGLLLAHLFNLEGLGHDSSVLQNSMPIAIATIILTTEFDVLPNAMTTAVVLTTLLSPLTLTMMIQLLQYF